MNDIFSLYVFVVDAILVVVLAGRTLVLIERDYLGLVETTLGWMLLSISWIVGTGVILGLTGALGSRGFVICHLVSLALLSFFRKDSVEKKYAVRFFSEWKAFFSRRSSERLIAAGLIVALLILAAMASRAQPTVFDALTYRLSRVGQWLQDGRISNLSTDDPRINYMPVGPDLVIGWLLGATDEGFFLAPLSQTIGGVFVMVATYGLARTVKLNRLAALGAVALVLGMANVAVQFTTIQSDLFTAGIFASSYLLWHRALERGKPSVVGGIGVALAWGSKGTLFYLAPGAAIWVIWLVWNHRRSYRALGPTLIAGLIAGALFVVPGYCRNVKTYGSVFGPPEAVLLHHGPHFDVRQRFEKLCLNVETSAIQLLDPTAQPFWCRTALRDFGRKILPILPATDDPYLFLHDFPRRILAEGILLQTQLDADIASCGMLAIGLFVLGGVIAARRWRDRTQAQIAIWCVGVVVYCLMQHAMVQWHQWAFRFAVIAAPWMAVAGASAIDHARSRWRTILWVVAVVSATEIAWRAQSEAHQSAWPSLRRPDEGKPLYLYSHWHAWAEQLNDADIPVRLALPINSPIGAFYRTSNARPITMEKLSSLPSVTAEQAVAGKNSWLVVPALRFMGNEGNVMGYTFLYAGEGASGSSLAAYRTLRPGEIPRLLIYRASRELTPARLHRAMLVRSWTPDATLNLRNPGTQPCRYAVKTVAQKNEGDLGANESVSIPLKMDTRRINAIDVEVKTVSGGSFLGGEPTVILMNPDHP